MSAVDVDVWIRDLDAPDLSAPSDSLLGASERARARELRPGRIRDRWVAGRSTLRSILGKEVGVDPRHLGIEKGPHGKPFLPDSPVHFNLSHSGPLLAVAITRVGPVGLDVELVSEMNDMRAVAERICDPHERRFLDRHEDEVGERLEAFYRIWTAKEAVLKGAGVGFEVSPSAVHVDVAESTPRLVDPVPASLGSGSWSLEAFQIPPEDSWAPTPALGTVALDCAPTSGASLAPRVRRWRDADDR